MARQFSVDNRLRACAAHHPRRCRSALNPSGLASSNNAGATKCEQVSSTCGHSSALGRTRKVARSSRDLSSHRSL